MKTLTQPVVAGNNSPEHSGDSLSTSKNTHQPRRFARSICGGLVAICLATSLTDGYARELITWDFLGLGNNPGGSTEDGIAVSDSDSGSDPMAGNYTGTVYAALCQSDLAVSWNGDSIYEAHTAASSLLEFQVYGSGTVAITITPHAFIRSWDATPTPPDGGIASCEVKFSLSIARSKAVWAVPQCDKTLSGRGSEGATVVTDLMDPYTIYTGNGELVSLEMNHQDIVNVDSWATGNSWLSASVASVAWYEISVSANGYISGTAPFAGKAVAVLPPSAPQITKMALGHAGQNLMTASGIGGPNIAALPYWVMTSTNLSQPLSAWDVCQTNTFASDGTFSFSVPVNDTEPQRFYQVKTLP